MDTRSDRRRGERPTREAQRHRRRLRVFGITGDLAKVMTFRSLYRLERRGLLDCPIVGVAVDDWTVDQLGERARESIEGTGEQLDETVFDRFAARLSYVAGRLRRRRDLRAGRRRRSRARSTPVFYLEIPPFLFGTRRQGPGRGRPDEERRASSSRSRSATTSPRPRALADELHQYIDESQLYRIDHYLGKMGLEEILYLRFANSMLEPVWNRNYLESRADHDGRGLRRRGPRPLLRPRRRAARRRRQPPDAGRSPRARWRRRPGGDPRDDQGRAGRALPRGRRGRPRRTTCAASTTATASIDGVAPDSTTETYAALRLDIENWRWSGVPFFIRTGKRLPVTQTELRLVFKHPPRLGFAADGRDAEPNQLVVKLDPSTGIRLVRRRAPGRRGRAPARSSSTWSSRRRAARARRRTRCCSTPRWSATARASPARTASRRRGGSCSRCSTRRRRSSRTRRARGGPRRPTTLVAGYGRWHEPWIAS